ncbi:uncharacterized protein LOC125674485 [Ostrea edulis]|uniref:uncharacterized protein LOC125674485 n=1 Tax=Ostrea edulis TaxID=37623 RepID=UPI0024AE88F6|nr:uncharacterized protein LOC125674485 [Ostrea edulis]
MHKTKSKRGAPRSTTSDQSQHAQAVQTGRNRRTRRSNADPSVAHGGVQPQIPVVQTQIPVVQPQIPVLQPKDHFQPPQRVQPGVELTPSTAVGLVQEPGTYSRPQPSANPSFVPEVALSSEISRLLHSSLYSKTDQLGRGTTLTVHKMTGTTCPIQAMHDYMEIQLKCGLLDPPLLRGQKWLPDPGQGDQTLTFQTRPFGGKFTGV